MHFLETFKVNEIFRIMHVSNEQCGNNNLFIKFQRKEVIQFNDLFIYCTPTHNSRFEFNLDNSFHFSSKALVFDQVMISMGSNFILTHIKKKKKWSSSFFKTFASYDYQSFKHMCESENNLVNKRK